MACWYMMALGSVTRCDTRSPFLRAGDNPDASWSPGWFHSPAELDHSLTTPTHHHEYKKHTVYSPLYSGYSDKPSTQTTKSHIHDHTNILPYPPSLTKHARVKYHTLHLNENMTPLSAHLPSQAHEVAQRDSHKRDLCVCGMQRANTDGSSLPHYTKTSLS